MAAASKAKTPATQTVAKKAVKKAAPAKTAVKKAAAKPAANKVAAKPVSQRAPAKPAAKNAPARTPAKTTAKPAAASADKVQGPASYFPSIEKTYGQPVAHWFALIDALGARKHMELVAELKSAHGLGHGHANALVAYRLAGRR